MLVGNLFFVDRFVFVLRLLVLDVLFVDLDWIVDLFGDVHGFVNFLLDDFLFLDDDRLVVDRNLLHKRVCVLLLFHFYWDVDDDLSMAATVETNLNSICELHLNFSFQLTLLIRQSSPRAPLTRRSAEINNTS